MKFSVTGEDNYYGTDESVFIEIFVNENDKQLKKTFDEYMSLTNHSIEAVIEDEFQLGLEYGLLAICKLLDWL